MLQSTSSPTYVDRTAVVPARWSYVSWGAILAGLTAAIAFQVIFMMLGAGLGFAIYSPITDEKPILELGAGALVVQGVSAVFSLWFGGWVAGRFTPIGFRGTGWLHGFIVWCSATVAGILLVGIGAGWALGDLSKLVGGGMSLAAKPAAAAVGGMADLAKDAAKQSMDTVTSFIDEVAGRIQNANPSTTARAKRQIGLALGRMINPLQKDNMAQNRAALLKAVVDTTGISQADAEKALAEWTAGYDQLKADLAAAKESAEAKAREAADKAAKALSIFCLGAFFAFVVGAIAAACGGCSGAKVARKHGFEPVTTVL